MVLALILLVMVMAGLVLAVFLLLQLFIFKAPLVSSPKAIAEAICQAIPLTKHDVVYDLGCGDSRILANIEKKIGCICIGYDISPLAYVRSKITIHRMKSNVTMHMKNFFSADIRDATVVFCFLIPSLMQKTSQRIISQCKTGTYIFSYGYELPNLKKMNAVSVASAPSMLYMYQR